ncbi:MAG: hypothetical protein IT456_27790 [Planctomycetes bacterium]|nr:hypothetical protein [Planctomycetota bacterium]
MVETTAYVTQIAFRANGDLVVGGTFTHIGSNAVTGIGIANQNIARWDGTSWSGLGAGISPSVRALAVTSDDVPVVENQSHLLERFDCPENYARWTWFGQTCPAAPGLPSIGIDSSRPAIGHDVTLTASQFPVNCTFGGILVSWTRLSPGIDLTSVGMPGCYQHVGPGAYFTFVPVAQSGSHTFPIPLMPALLGAHIHAQAIGLIPGANPTGASTSIGIDLAMGRL